MTSNSTKVFLYVYDLSRGLASSLSSSLLGKQIEGIWHTSVVVNDTEFFFGKGISRVKAGTSIHGTPNKIIELGETHLPMEVIDELVDDLRNRYTANTYHLLNNNCNNFTDELSRMIVGTGIPDHILKLPREVMSTPLGQSIQPLVNALHPHPQMGPVGRSTPPAQQNSTSVRTEVEREIRQEFASLIATGEITPNQAAAMALEKIREIYGNDEANH